MYDAFLKRLLGHTSWRLILIVLSALAITAVLSSAVQAAKVHTLEVRETTKMPKIRPEFPWPTDKDLLFFLQRSPNENTIVYTANFLANGQLNPTNPVNVFWRRFNDEGEKKDLGFFENRVAFGIKVKKNRASGDFEIEFRALPGRKITLHQIGPHQVELTGQIRDHTVKPIYIYVEVDTDGIIPKVTALYLYGIDLSSGQAITEVISVSGGKIKQ